MKTKIRKGTKVKWTSQAKGYAKEKYGKVMKVVPPGEHPIFDVPPGTKIHFEGEPRKEESYVVMVEGETSRGLLHLYWPRAKHLRVCK